MSKMIAPLVSIVMPVFNDERFLKEAIESILSQTLTDFELIVINDGSTDSSKAILDTYLKDIRLKVFDQENQGLVAALNRGCSLAKGKYIARMDGDDISLPRRLEKQVAFLETHENAGVVGAWTALIDEENNKFGIWRLPVLPGVIGWSLHFTSCLAHPAVVMRQEIIKALGFYNPAAVHAEDYDLWVRAAGITKIFNLGEVLLERRTRKESVSSLNSQTQINSTIKIMKSMISESLHTHVSLRAASLILEVQRANHSSIKTIEEIESSTNIIKQLHRTYLDSTLLSDKEIEEISRDVARKLAILAFSARRLAPTKSLSLLSQALRLDPQLAFRVIAKGKRIVYTQ